MPENFQIECALKELICEPAVTSEQKEANESDQGIPRNMANIIKYCKKEYLILKDIVDDMHINEPVPVKAENLTEFYTKSHQHQKDIEYNVNSMLVFEGQTLTDAHWHVCYKLFVAIRKYFLSEKADIFPVSDREISYRQLTDSSKSRIRYVGGIV